MEISLQSSIEQFNAAFTRYAQYTRKSQDEALERKAKNIGIRAFKLYQAHQYGGAPKQAGIAEADLEVRTDLKRGTKLRQSLAEEYAEGRSNLLSERRKLRKQKKSAGVNGGVIAAALAENSVKRQALWQKMVKTETKKRQQGIGYLSASFLAMRKRKIGDGGIVYVVNKSGRGIGYVLREQGLLRIASLADGSGLVDDRYGIIAKAIADETAEFTAWMDAKDEENRHKSGIN